MLCETFLYLSINFKIPASNNSAGRPWTTTGHFPSSHRHSARQKFLEMRRQIKIDENQVWTVSNTGDCCSAGMRSLSSSRIVFRIVNSNVFSASNFHRINHHTLIYDTLSTNSTRPRQILLGQTFISIKKLLTLLIS